MKVFISWSGKQSKRLGEAIRDWLPAVIQLVSPYFTPSDIEKGARWSTDIAKELSDSQVGILCITRDNIHSDWVLFEAGALSKSLEKSNVCPILFGITNTDLDGPLKQFQSTEFEKSDFQKLLTVINSRLGDNKLPPKTLESVFEKWWPDLEKKVSEILEKVDEVKSPIRSDRELLEEVLQLTRARASNPMRPSIAIGGVAELLQKYIDLHDEQVSEDGGYQETLNSLKEMHKSVRYIAGRYRGISEDVDELIKRFDSLSYAVPKKINIADEEIPF